MERCSDDPDREPRDAERYKRALEPDSPRRQRRVDDDRRGRRRHRHGRLPCAVAQRVGQLAPRPARDAARDDDAERDERSRDREAARDERAGCVDQEQRDRHQDEIEEPVQENRRQEPEAQEDQRPHDRRQEQLDQPRVRREAGIARMSAREHERLHDDGDRDRRGAMAEAVPDQCGERERHRAEEALFHEAGLQRQRDRPERRHGAAQDLGIGQHLGGLPPAKETIGRGIEDGDERELERHEQIAAERAPQDGRRRCRLARSHAPELRVRGERAPRQAFRAHEDEREQQSAGERRGRGLSHFAQPERGHALRRIEAEPRTWNVGERRGAEQRAHDEAGRERRPPQQPVPPREPEDADDAAANAVKERGDHARRAGDRIVRAPQFAEPAPE
jgi:hypothetical protein